MPQRLTPQQIEALILEANPGQKSDITEQLARRRNNPVYSVGQGVAQAGGDIISAIMKRRQGEKDKAQQDQRSSALIEALSGVQNMVGDQSVGPTASPQQATSLMVDKLAQRTDPTFALKAMGAIDQQAQANVPPWQYMDETLPDGSIGQRGRDGQLTVPFKAPAPQREAVSSEFQQYLDMYDGDRPKARAAMRAAVERKEAGAAGKPKGLADLFKDKIGGDVPKDMRPVVGDNGLPTGGVEPLPGGPADPAVIASAIDQKKAAARPGAEKYKQASEQMLDAMLDKIARIKSNPATKDVVGSIEGRAGVPTSFLDDDESNAWSDIQSLRSSAQLKGLQDIRASSPTGGGVGSVTETEWPKLESGSGNLDPAQGEDQFWGQLDALEKQTKATKAALNSAFEKDYGGAQDEPDYDAAPPGSTLLPDGRIKLQDGRIAKWKSK